MVGQCGLQVCAASRNGQAIANLPGATSFALRVMRAKRERMQLMDHRCCGRTVNIRRGLAFVSMNMAVVTQIAERATSLRLDLDAPFDDLDPLTDRVRDAKVVALGSAVRHSHELCTLTDRVMRFLMDQHGFRSLALEGDEAASIGLDTYVQVGECDLRAILAGARSFWRFAEILEAVRWIRARNEQNPSDQVRVVHVAEQPREAVRQLAGGESIERRVADLTIAWHEQTGHRIVYWGGLAHTANGLATGSNAGSHLRQRFGSGYVSIALTFHHGSLPALGSLPLLVADHPPADYVEAVLGAVDLETYLLKIHGDWPQSVREWLDVPAKTRLIGPGIHELLGPSLRTWFDFIIHSRRITPARAL
jgi:erythromycin esterase